MNKYSIIINGTLLAISLIGVARADNYNWTGYYAGVNAGLIVNDAQLKSQHLGFTNPSQTFNSSSTYASFSPGIQLGYVRQYSNQLVSGVEANIAINANQIEEFNSRSNFNAAVYDQFTFRNQWQSSIKARLGRAINWDNRVLLPYVTAGASFAGVGLSYKNEGGDYYSENSTQVGWLLGAGVEWVFRQHWSLRAEYNYIDYGNAVQLSIPSVYGLIDPNGGGHVDLSSNSVVVAVNYWI